MLVRILSSVLAVLGVALVLAIAVYAIREEIAATRRRREAWTNAVRVLSAGRVEAPPGTGFDLTTTDGVRLVVGQRQQAGENEPGMRLHAEGGVPPELAIGAEGMASRLGKLILGADIETGDDAFDRAVLVRGSEASVVALLDRRTRSLLAKAVACGTTITNGAVRREVLQDAQTFAQIVDPSRELAVIVRDIAQRSRQSVPVLLRENVTSDPVPGVRRRSLEVLLGNFAGHEETRVALDAACVDADPGLRLFASSSLGSEGLGDLEAIAVDSSLSNSVRADALRQILTAQPGARSLAVAERALADRSSAVRTIAISAIGRARRAASLPILLSLGSKAQDADEQIAFAEACWRLRDPSAEGVLLPLLERGALPVKVEVARALGRCGGVASVAPLRALSQGLLAGELGRVAQESIVGIHARLRHAAEGQLSVSEAESSQGQVSLSNERGGVAVLPKKDGQRS